MFRPELIALLCAYAFLSACATTSSTAITDVRQPSDLAACDQTENINRNMDDARIVKLLDEGRFHAALARLDSISEETAYIRYLRAHVLRQLGRQSEAHELYEALLTTCMEGYARHGLGLLSARHDDINAARDYLAQAREQLPLDTRVRNDYGYVLLLDEQPQEAYAEFMTALELNEDARQPKYNALVTLLLLDRMNQAHDFAERMELTKADIARAVTEAQQVSHDWSQPYQPAKFDAAESSRSEVLPLKLETRTGATQER